eukprot:gb/GECG01003509.1/.p1 GENE.gb/GECG01003509.1/~~gb/GECG01003509.1/.p1  ORF type:complete len:176 (+),score=20.95 gb/GECG01003509.1/:1-528(+)
MNTNGTASGNGRQAAVAGSGASSIQSTPRAKSHLVRLAEMEDRNKAPIKGYLKKENSQKRWQKRWFEIVGHYFVYYKRYDSPEMLCAMDLNRAQNPAVIMESDGQGGTVPTCEFSIRWDRYRLFRAETPEEAVRWVNVMRAVQDAHKKPTKSEEDIRDMEEEDKNKSGCKCCTVM